jgi:hypothetical protein
VFQQPRQQYLLQEVSQLLQEQKWQAPEQELQQQELHPTAQQIRQPSSLRGLTHLSKASIQLQLQQLLLEQLLFSQQLFWQEPSLQVLRHQQKEHQLS